MKELMVCCVCGEIDDDFTAYCNKCGKVPHRLMTKEEHKEFKTFLDKLSRKGRNKNNSKIKGADFKWWGR